MLPFFSLYPMHIHRSAARAVRYALRDTIRPAFSGTLLALSVACGGGTADSAKKAPAATLAASDECSPKAGETASFVAVRDYIKSTEPKPLRFLSAAGTDSAIADDAMQAMQDKGPTYYYAGKDEQKKAIRDKLIAAGPFTALLVVKHGDTKNADGTRTIRLGGHFVTGEMDGKSAKSQSYTMSCGKDGWVVASKKDEG